MSIRVLHSPFSRSLSIHLLLLLMLFIYATHAPKIQFDEPISITLIEPDAVKEEKDRNRMVVQPSEGELAKDATKNAYLSDKTRITKDERSSKVIGTNQPAAQPMQPTTPQTRQKPVSVSDLGLKFNPLPNRPENEKRWVTNNMGEAVRGGQYIQGLKEGETSALNTKEFVFFSYFERVRRQLDQTWQPMVRGEIARIYKTGRHLASQTDFVTRTMITLNGRGEILRVQLLEESGAIDLDAAAVKALNKAGPYPNPPKGLLDASGNAQIRWDFVLKT